MPTPGTRDVISRGWCAGTGRAGRRDPTRGRRCPEVGAQQSGSAPAVEWKAGRRYLLQPHEAEEALRAARTPLRP